MTVETDLEATLAPLVGGKCFPDMAPMGAEAPFITYQQAGGQAPTFLELDVPSMQNGRFAINVWAYTRMEAKAIALQAEAVLVASALFQAKPLSAAVALYDDDAELRGSSQDFSVWSDR